MYVDYKNNMVNVVYKKVNKLFNPRENILIYTKKE